MFYYMPSCKFQAANMETSRKLKDYFGSKEGFQVTGCCKPSQKLFREGDTVLNNCCSCALFTEELSPFVHSFSVYEYLLGDPAFPWPDYHGERITVQDCWRANGHHTEQEAVRECLRRMNMEPVELEENFGKCEFDGTWRFSPKPQQEVIAPEIFGRINREFITPVPEEEWQKRMQEHVSQYTTERTVAYCNACLSGIRLGGAEGVHLLQLMCRDL